MQQHTNALFNIVRQVLSYNLVAQAHRGDTLGLWTYNEDIYAGAFPLQKWSPGNTAIAERVADFLRAQKFERIARLDKVIPPLLRLNKNSQFITVLLICLGDTDIQGTPFDDTINQFLRTWRNKGQGAGTPFVIALRGQAGAFVAYTLTPSPWPAELPALPQELLTPLKPVQPVATVTNKPPAPTVPVPPLIVSGRKHETTQANASAAPATLVTASGSVVASNPAGDPSLGATAPGGSVNSSQATVATAANPNPSAASTADPAALPANTHRQEPPPLNAATDSRALEKIRDLHSAPTSVSNAAGPQIAEASAVPPSPNHRLALVVTAVASAIALLGAVILWRARPRRTADTSIITESFDRRKK
jgi:hypothetical protein